MMRPIYLSGPNKLIIIALALTVLLCKNCAFLTSCFPFNCLCHTLSHTHTCSCIISTRDSRDVSCSQLIAMPLQFLLFYFFYVTLIAATYSITCSILFLVSSPNVQTGQRISNLSKQVHTSLSLKRGPCII